MKKVTLLLVVAALVTAAQANLISNGDFESYSILPSGQSRGIGDLLYWFPEEGSTWDDSGTEAGGYNPTGTRNLYLMGVDGSACQTTSHVIGAGDVFNVSMLMGDIWEWAYAEISLYYDDPANVFWSETIYSDFAGTGWWTTMSLYQATAAATAASEGGLLGIKIKNLGDIYLPDPGINGTWAAFDDVVVTVPEPATMALLGLGALVLRRRK